jgi:hypothetical protein
MVNPNRWLAIRLEFLGAMAVFAASLAAVLSRTDLSSNPGLMGLSITYALLLSLKLNWFVRVSTEVENAFVCVERWYALNRDETLRLRGDETLRRRDCPVTKIYG